MPASATATAPRTFWSEAALAAAVDAAFAEALAEELAAALADAAPARPAIVLPDTDTLIRQAGIVTGPCPPDPCTPSATGRFLKKASIIAARAAWWLLKHTTLCAGVLLVGALRVTWHLAAERRPSPDRAIAPADFLEATSEHIKTRGWTQFVMESRRGVCILGAERDLIRSGTGTRATASEANGHLLAVTGSRSVPGWNDQLTRTEAQVHQALLVAAARARAAR
ncbi:hypothetical protein J7E93_06635 [Streptomyces sp. ISL-36]|uniref:DUF6197 family protein n=1 Tax=Streptomyces sp. ISL-36 TaxID=2819182 RepID=UPI001BE5A6C0|nr:hypothetical protein [Streptomyces sp. ISL-36]MBT2439802.1 hypothetical protein [Streptomyces sp. ISL-36]